MVMVIFIGGFLFLAVTLTLFNDVVEQNTQHQYRFLGDERLRTWKEGWFVFVETEL